MLKTCKLSFLIICTPNCQDLITTLGKSCIVCRLNRNPKARKTKGTEREYEGNEEPNSVWCADIIYLPVSKQKYRYLLTLTERLSSYVAGVPLKTLNSTSVSNAFQIFLSIMPKMLVLTSDHGQEFLLNCVFLTI